MPAAGERTCFCEFLEPGGLTGAGETSPDPASWPKWHEAWGKMRGLRGGEVVANREREAQTLVEFYFDYPDVMNPLGDGKKVTEQMAIRFDGEIYGINAVFPDETHKREVRVLTTKNARGYAV